jgi:PKD repeat protein
VAEGWDGSTPIQQDDGPSTSYELGQDVTVNEDVTITHVRVWHGASSAAVVGRSARLWAAGGAELDAVLLDDSLAPGWSTFELDAPLERTAGSTFVVSYSTTRYYGAVTGELPNSSTDGALTFTGGRFRDGGPGLFPNVTTTTFYGIDVVYELGIGGNVPPVPTVAVVVDGYDVAATISVVDESPAAVGYRVGWGDGTATITSEEVVEHTYATHGLYAVSVLATDAGGAVGVTATPVVVRQPGGGMDVDAVIVELADQLRTIVGLEVFDEVPGKIAKTPAAIVAWPESIVFDAGGRRSTDTLMIPIVVCLTRNVPRVGRRELGGYASGRGPTSVKTVLEGGVYTTLRGIIVGDGLFDVVTIGGTEYIAVVFTANVKG